MKLTVLQENLHKSLQVASRVVSARATLPVLGNVLLKAEEGRLLVSATNLEVGVTSTVGAKIKEPGEITIPAKLLADFVSALPAGKIELELNGDTLQIQSGTASAHMKGIASSEFPLIPQSTEGIKLSLQSNELSKAIAQVSFAASSEESRPVLTGVLLRIGGQQLRLVATDSYRLAERIIALTSKPKQEMNVIIPARALAELGRILSEEEEQIEVVIGENQIHFNAPNTQLTSRLIEGQFPTYEQIIPESFETKSMLETSAFLSAVRMAALFAKESANNIKLEFAPAENAQSAGKLTIESATTHLGDTKTVVPTKVEGKDGEISFNARYLQDVLGVVGPNIQFEMSGKLNPGVIRDAADPNYLHIIMPLRS
jgi:DNA polymerase III subunit beta